MVAAGLSATKAVAEEASASVGEPLAEEPLAAAVAVGSPQEQEDYLKDLHQPQCHHPHLP